MKNRLIFIPAFTFVITFLIVGSLGDLQIAQGIYLADNAFSHFMAAFTIFPIAVGCGFMVTCIFRLGLNKYFKKKWQNFLLIVFDILILVAGSYYFGKQVTSYHAYNLSSSLNIPLGLLLTLPGVILECLFHQEINKEHILKFYLYLFVVVILASALIEGFKILMPRVRYTTIVDPHFGPLLYRPWYQPNFLLTDYFKQHPDELKNIEEIKSFPSGHSAIAFASAFVLMYLPRLFPRLKGKEPLFFLGGMLFFVLVAISRMMIGAHYLSDTMFAGLICLSLYFVSNEIYLRKLI